jgi:cell division protein FtsI/penicillin-binding protein 2
MPPYSNGAPIKPANSILRTRIWFAVIMVVFGIFLVRLFYLQIIRHDYYKQSASVGHLKEYEITATRGVIKAHNGSALVPIALNQTLYTVYADPTLVRDHAKVAETLAAALGKGSTASYEAKLRTQDTRYVVIARMATEEQKEAIIKKKYAGIGAQEQQYRTYPNGKLASQLLGFVNSEGEGTYGLEQALDDQLAGKPGQLKAVTDVHGVPLAANTDNILIEPVPGEDVVLTIDVAMQKQLEDILRAGLKRARSTSGSALILEANTGAVKAMANWPTYDPSKYAQIEDGSVFTNAAVSAPLEVGSTMKPLTAAAALDQGVVQPSSTYYDPASYKIDGFTVKNIEEDGGPGTKDVADILNMSLNTGATWLLMKMGGSNDEINREGREVWYRYMADHYMFGKETGIEQGYEAPGDVPHPNDGYARDLVYANSTFGQAMTATPLQMAAAYAAVLNGGTYYQPQLVDYTVSADGAKHDKKPKAIRRHVVSDRVSEQMQPLLEYVVDNHYFVRRFDQQHYSVGGKTGTAEIAGPDGRYLEHDFNGTYVGFVGGDQPQYVVAILVNKPKIAGYAGSQAAQPLFGDLAHMLIDKFNVTPRR